MSILKTTNDHCWGVLLPGESRAGNSVFRRLGGVDRDAELATIQQAAGQVGALCDTTRLLMILRSDQRSVLNELRRGPGRVVEQPADRGTAPAFFLAASYVRAEDPEGTMVALPSDSLPIRPHIFQAHLAEALRSLETEPDSLIMLAASAARPDPDLGWIEPGEGMNGSLRPVRRLHSRATRSEAERFFRRGLLVDTRTLVVKVSTLWNIGLELFPAMISRFEDLTDLLRLIVSRRVSPEIEELALRDVYRGLESLNFGRRILNHVVHRLRLLPIRTTGTDWGHVAVAQPTTEPVSPRPLAV